jgi:hypothetical protein
MLRGRAVQVDPIKPTLKAPRSKCLKLECENQLSSGASKFNRRRYTVVLLLDGQHASHGERQGLTLIHLQLNLSRY